MNTRRHGDDTVTGLDLNAEVIALLCVHLPGVATERSLGPKEWHALAGRLARSGISPSQLRDHTAEEIAEELGLPVLQAKQLVRLLKRRQHLELELKRFERLGIWVLTLADEGYPTRWRERVGAGTPPVLFGAGGMRLLQAGGLAIVGSRNVDEAGREFAQEVARRCARSGLTVVSGGAQGVDSTALRAAVEAGGTAVGVLSHGLETALCVSEMRQSVTEGAITLVSPYHPATPFSVGNAMARNKLVYALADYALVVASNARKGGTWAGASEALRRKLVPVFVRDVPSVPVGNRELVAQGAIPFPSQLEGDLAQFLQRAGEGETFRRHNASLFEPPY